jgi:hypothetical protein
MKNILNILILTFLLFSFNSNAQSEAMNCEVARKKYLELNPDVAKVGMDAWSHYSNYGKKEGRIWPPCSVSSGLFVNSMSNSSDSVFNSISSIGSLTSKAISQYNLNKVNNTYDFYNKPLSILAKIPDDVILQLNGLKEKKILDNFLKGVDSIPLAILKIEEALSAYPKISLDGYFRVSQEISELISNNNRILVLGDSFKKNYKKYNKLRKYGRVRLEHNSDFNFVIIPPSISSKRMERKLAKLTSKKTALIFNKENKEEFFRKIYKVSIEYARLYENNINLKKMSEYASTFFTTLNSSDASSKTFSYIGKTNNGIPVGFGYLLNDNKQLICSAYWDEGFPLVLYSVNIYYNPKSSNQFYKYIIPRSPNGTYNKRKIELDVLDYEKTDVRTFNIYFGECNDNNMRNGFGCYFWEVADKNNLQYYQGNWGGSGQRNGEGTQYINNVSTFGKWNNGELSNGTISWPDKSIYKGAIKDLKMHGIGKKTYENGKIEEGLFENGYLSKTLAQLQQELIQKQREQELEYIRQEEMKRIAREEADRNPTYKNGHKKYVEKNSDGYWSSIECESLGEFQCWYCGFCVYLRGGGLGWEGRARTYTYDCVIEKGGAYCSRSCAEKACLADF